MRFDPVRCFAGYASNVGSFDSSIDTVECLPDALVRLVNLSLTSLAGITVRMQADWQELLRQHTGCSCEHV